MQIYRTLALSLTHRFICFKLINNHIRTSSCMLKYNNLVIPNHLANERFFQAKDITGNKTSFPLSSTLMAFGSGIFERIAFFSTLEYNEHNLASTRCQCLYILYFNIFLWGYFYLQAYLSSHQMPPEHCAFSVGMFFRICHSDSECVGLISPSSHSQVPSDNSVFIHPLWL